MSDVSYYKTNNPAYLAAFDDFKTKKSEVIKASEAFKNEFNASGLLYKNSFGRFSFGGLVFDSPQPDLTWTKPDKNGMQWPRPITSIKKADKPQHKELLDKWQSLKPTLTADLEPFLKSMGLSSGDFFFGGKISIFYHEGWIFIQSSKKPADDIVEILGSEFNANKYKGEA